MIQLARYAVQLEPGLIDRIGPLVAAAARAHRYAVITDDTVRGLYADRVARSFPPDTARVYSFKPGEEHKTRKTWASLTDALLADGLGRDTTVVALGGGVVGDLAGFLAATFMRGVPVVQVPTTLLAMVDASVGGKTGVDVPAGKNLVGAFHWPAAVLADPEVLATLPAPDLRGGLAEAIKHGIIADRTYFEQTLASLPSLKGSAFDRSAMLALIEGSIRIKAAIVEADEREGGRRKVLNFGHTIGHALEQATRYRIPHGDAVAIGMLIEARIAVAEEIATTELIERLLQALRAAGLPHRPPEGITADAIVNAAHADKKVIAGRVHLALPAAVGRMTAENAGWAVAVDDARIRQTWDRARSEL